MIEEISRHLWQSCYLFEQILSIVSYSTRFLDQTNLVTTIHGIAPHTSNLSSKSF
ncbi:hypothetical protein HanPSC8_Chr04g0143101 [Helianthus annuus]|nr:hypothetical protein HanPSC8_Chr04g0143101 [Helianthus annuus]